jgi:hypothetical protein
MAVARFTTVGSWLCCCAVALAIGACGEATGPDASVTVDVSVTRLDGPFVTQPSLNEWAVECTVFFTAAATGNRRATWLDGVLVFYAGPDRTTGVDSIFIPASDIQESWSAQEIAPGAVQQSGWRITASVPYDAAFVFHYRPAGTNDTKSLRVRFACSPAMPVDPAAPTITDFTVFPAQEAEPNGVLSVHYVATSAVGLWVTEVAVTGACTVTQRFSERFSTSAEHTVPIQLPRTCAVGGTIAVSVSATNNALQRTTLFSPSPLAVVDRTPPSVFGQNWPTASQYFFAGDTLLPFVGAFDNRGVRAIIWEIQPGGYRDSVLGEYAGFLPIRLRPELAGATITVRLFARDVGGLVSDTVVALLPGLPIYPSVERPIVLGTVPGQFERALFDPARPFVYITYGIYATRILMLSATTLGVARTIALPTIGGDADFSLSGDSLIVVLPYSRGLGVIDATLTTDTVALYTVRTLESAQSLGAMRVGSNGKVYVKLESQTVATGLLEIDLAAGTERLVSGGGGLGSSGMQRSGDRTTLIFSRGMQLLQRYDVPQDAFSTAVTPQSLYGPLDVDATAATIAFGLDIYDHDLVFQRRVAGLYGGEAIPGAALSVDGQYLYQVLGFRGVGRAVTSDGTAVDRIPTPISAAGQLAFSPDGTRLFFGNYSPFTQSSRIAVIDLR